MELRNVVIGRVRVFAESPSSWRTNRQLRDPEDWNQQARATLKLTPSLPPHSCLSAMTGFENPRGDLESSDGF